LHVRAISFNGAAHDRRIALSSVARGCSVQPRIWEAATAIAPGTIVVANPDAVGGAGALIAVDPANGLPTRVMGSTLFRRPFGMAVQADGQVLVACLEQAVIRVNPAKAIS
jgi:hypothetical protein